MRTTSNANNRRAVYNQIEMVTTSKFTTTETAWNETKHSAAPRASMGAYVSACVCVCQGQTNQLNYGIPMHLVPRSPRCTFSTSFSDVKLNKYLHIFAFYCHFLFAAGQDRPSDSRNRLDIPTLGQVISIEFSNLQKCFILRHVEHLHMTNMHVKWSREMHLQFGCVKNIPNFDLLWERNPPESELTSYTMKTWNNPYDKFDLNNLYDKHWEYKKRNCE